MKRLKNVKKLKIGIWKADRKNAYKIVKAKIKIQTSIPYNSKVMSLFIKNNIKTYTKT